MANRCADCKKWEYRNNNFGFCRANAPAPTIAKASASDEFTLVWPSTGRDDFCYDDFEEAEKLKAIK